MSEAIKEIDRQIKEARAASNSPYLTLNQKIEAKQKLEELTQKRLEARRTEILKEFDNTSDLFMNPKEVAEFLNTRPKKSTKENPFGL